MSTEGCPGDARGIQHSVIGFDGRKSTFSLTGLGRAMTYIKEFQPKKASKSPTRPAARFHGGMPAGSGVSCSVCRIDTVYEHIRGPYDVATMWQGHRD